MENRDIDQMMGSVEAYGGTYSSDTLPRKLKNDFVYVVNTMPSYSAGEHWLAVWKDDSTAEMFDSFGLPPSRYGFLEKRMDCGWTWSTKQLQNNDLSSTCGQYVCGYILFKNCGGALPEYISLFGDDLAVNDATVHSFINKAYDRDFKLHDLNLLKNLFERGDA